MKNLHVRAKIVKLLEGNIDENVHSLKLSNFFFRYDTKSATKKGRKRIIK